MTSGAGETATRVDEIPPIISVDDHVVEPPDVWTARIPSRYQDRVPRLVRERGRTVGGIEARWVTDSEGSWADVWHYDDVVVPLTAGFAAAGSDDPFDISAKTYDDIRPGCWQVQQRLADMDLARVEVSVLFPNFFTRFCGQTFAQRTDKDFALRCLQAYNDWILEDWCTSAKGRLVPVNLIPLWDADLAAAEVRRCAAKGGHAISFTEMPTRLGLPSLYSRSWDPVFAACEEVLSTICIHIGTVGFATTSEDAPNSAMAALTWQYGMYGLIDWILSGTFDRFPQLKLMLSESNVGWMYYLLERMDMLWHERRGHPDAGWNLPRRPSEYIRDRVYGCIVDDEIGLQLRDRIGMEQICYETDYPHLASLWPNIEATVLRLKDSAHLSDDEVTKFVRGNAIKAFRLDQHFGITA